uniref:RNA polymerase sigma factor n=1 Tax=uncultured Thiotrichaceae bacterium TaxID=298394 RepID=A0A6S6SXZ8_9GAMM|nr:MAG: RNA polymerase sigma factor [uncultured Thiotrichaceae bacterium]
MDHFLKSVERRAFVTARIATKDEEEALDIVQDAMLKLVQKYGDRPESEWGPLFHSILHSKIHDWYRRSTVRNRWRVFFGLDSDDRYDSPDERVPQTQFPEPDHQMSSDSLGEHLSGLIEQLPLRQQQAIILRAWEGYNIAETSKIMKCSEGSVKTHYSRAIHAMREKLGDYNG